MAEQRLRAEIAEYKSQLGKTSSAQRKSQLWRHIRKLEKELMIYRGLRYGR